MSRLIIFTIALVCLLGFGATQTSDTYYLEGLANDIGVVSIWVDNSNTNSPRLKIRYAYMDGIVYSTAIIGANYYTWAVVNDTVLQCAESKTLSPADFKSFQDVLNYNPTPKNYLGTFTYDGQYMMLYSTSIGNQGSMTYGFDNLFGTLRFVTLVFPSANYIEFGLRIDGIANIDTETSGNVWNIPKSCMSS